MVLGCGVQLGFSSELYQSTHGTSICGAFYDEVHFAAIRETRSPANLICMGTNCREETRFVGLYHNSVVPAVEKEDLILELVRQGL